MSKVRILVVEDEGLVARDVENMLESLGYEVPAIVSTGEAAIRSAQDLLPDLVLMDIVLKGDLSGIAAAVWEQMAPKLDEERPLSATEEILLGKLCLAEATVEEGTSAIEKAGGLAAYLAGKNSQTAPLVSERAKAITLVKALCGQLRRKPSWRQMGG